MAGTFLDEEGEKSKSIIMAGSQDFFSEIKSEVKDLGSKMNKLFDEVVRGKGDSNGIEVPSDMYETPSSFVYEVDIPGLDKTQVAVQIRDNALVVRGERVRDHDENVIYHMRERAHGEFERSFPLPKGIEENSVKAKFENGILRVTLPKEQEEEPEYDAREINID